MPTTTLHPVGRPWSGIIAFCCAVIACFALSPSAGAKSVLSTRTSYAGKVRGLATVADSALQNMLGAAPDDTRSWSDGVFSDPGSDNCDWCMSSAATAAAVLSRQTRPADPVLLNVAEATYKAAIAQHQEPDGSFDENAIETEFFTVDLAETYFELRDILPAVTRRAWAQAIVNAVNFIIKQKDLTWYANGNIQLRVTALMWMAWQITGHATYETDYVNSWNFTMNPPQARWPGYGINITRPPTKSDDSDGAGYLAESNQSDAPGFDPEYTMTQLDMATGMWTLTHDRRWLQLMNLFFNQLRSRINPTTFYLDGNGGTRESVVLPFFSGGLAVLYASGDRPDLASLVPGDLALLEHEFSYTPDFLSSNFYRGLSGWLGMIIANHQHPDGVAAATLAETQGARSKPKSQAPVRKRRHRHPRHKSVTRSGGKASLTDGARQRGN